MSVKSTCPYCGATDFFRKEQPPHFGLYCGGCGRWIRWIPKSQAGDYPTEPAIKDPPALELAHREQTLPGPGACDHTRQLDLLLESMNRCNRHLEIITRAMCNGVGR